MIDFLTLFKEQILEFLAYIIPIVSISFMSLGMVYIIGRLLEIAHNHRSKNIIALLFIIVFSIVNQNSSFTNWSSKIIMSIVKLITMSSIFYVLVCWKFYSRFDALLNKWIGDGDEIIKKKRKK